LIRKTGLLGGTFDPIHNGHLALAEAAGKLCNLSEIVLIPAAVPPHKQYRAITPFSHRVAMMKMAIAGKTDLHISSIEQILPKPSYSIDTIEYLKLHSVGDVEFYFITGADAFLDIQSWKQYRNVLENCNFIVFTRSGNKNKKLYKFFEHLEYYKNDTAWYNKKHQKYIYTPIHSLPDVSSSEIRTLVGKGKAVNNLAPEKVIDYIFEHKLYQR
jgi:nicotinate-nucleotide adenylyltransferase